MSNIETCLLDINDKYKSPPNINKSHSFIFVSVKVINPKTKIIQIIISILFINVSG